MEVVIYFNVKFDYMSVLEEISWHTDILLLDPNAFLTISRVNLSGFGFLSINLFSSILLLSQVIEFFSFFSRNRVSV